MSEAGLLPARGTPQARLMTTGTLIAHCSSRLEVPRFGPAPSHTQAHESLKGRGIRVVSICPRGEPGAVASRPPGIFTADEGSVPSQQGPSWA